MKIFALFFVGGFSQSGDGIPDFPRAKVMLNDFDGPLTTEIPEISEVPEIQEFARSENLENRCFQCKGKNFEECEENGEIATCAGEDDICQIEIRKRGGISESVKY